MTITTQSKENAVQPDPLQLDLRDWFAGQAIAGMFNHSGWLNTIDGDQEEVAKRAYLIADAMIAARKAGG